MQVHFESVHESPWKLGIKYLQLKLMQNILKNGNQIQHIFSRIIMLFMTLQYVVVKGVEKKHKIY